MGMRVIKPGGVWSITASLLMVVLLAGCAGADGGLGNATSEGKAPASNAAVTSNSPAPGAATPDATSDPLVLDILATPDAQLTPVAVDESALASELIDAPLSAESGPVGRVRGLALDVSTGRVRYLVIDANGQAEAKTFLLPWGLSSIMHQEPEEVSPGVNQTAAAVPTATGSDVPGVELVLSSQAGESLEAPGLDLDLLDRWQQAGALPAGWDGPARSYWSAFLMDERISGADGGESAGPVFYLAKDDFASERWQARDEGGQPLGQVQDLFLDPDGLVSFAAVYLPNFREQGDLSVVVPWKILVWKPETGDFYLTASLDTLAGAPVYDRAALPDVSVPGWDQEWQQYWQQDRQVSSESPSRAEQRGQSLISSFIGRPMLDVGGEEIGVVEDLVMGTGGNILYLVLRSGERLMPVPWTMFDYSDDTLIYIDASLRLEEAPGFTAGMQIDPSVPDWDREIRSYWGLGR